MVKLQSRRRTRAEALSGVYDQLLTLLEDWRFKEVDQLRKKRRSVFEVRIGTRRNGENADG